MPFKEIFRKANEFAEQFDQEISNDQLQDFILTCMPYFMYLRKAFGFIRIPIEDIKKEIAPLTINQAYLIQQRRKISFSYCLQNAFRDCCREQLKRFRDSYAGNIISKCDIDEPQEVMGGDTRYSSPELKVQEHELVELINNILKNHNHFSKQVVYQKIRGSTYSEVANIFSTTLNESKRVYWHDINHIRKELNFNSKED